MAEPPKNRKELFARIQKMIEQGGEKCYDSSTDETLQLKKGEAMDKPEITFKLAQRAKVFLSMAISGPSGSGKTYTSLMYARAIAGMDGKIALVDTENERASYYADVDGFRGNNGETFYNVILQPPYTVAKYIAAIKAAEQANFNVLVLDSITHEWQGSGGTLEVKNELDRRPGTNQWTNWALPTKQHNEFVAAIVNAKLHVICTMRSKEKYELVKNEKGQSVPVKLGMGPEQRPGTGYEFAVWLDMAMDHSAKVEKDITRVYAEKPDGIFRPTTEEASNLSAWLQQGIPLEQIERSVVSPAPGATELTEVLPGGDEFEKPESIPAANGARASGEKLSEVIMACKLAGTLLSAEMRRCKWSGDVTTERADAIIAGLKGNPPAASAAAKSSARWSTACSTSPTPAARSSARRPRQPLKTRKPRKSGKTRKFPRPKRPRNKTRTRSWPASRRLRRRAGRWAETNSAAWTRKTGFRPAKPMTICWIFRPFSAVRPTEPTLINSLLRKAKSAKQTETKSDLSGFGDVVKHILESRLNLSFSGFGG